MSGYVSAHPGRWIVALVLALGAVRAFAEEPREIFVLLQEPPSGRIDSPLARRARFAAHQKKVIDSLRHEHIRLRQTFTAVNAFSVETDTAGLAALRAHPEVWRADPLKYGSGGDVSANLRQIRADRVHRRDDFGQSVTVAVLDTGVQSGHPDLMGRISGEQCFCTGDCCPNRTSQQSGPGSAYTTHVHGMHVTGIIVSQGRIAPRGIAPRVSIVSVKVLNDQNRGSLLDWLRGLEWILLERPDVQVVNMSLVSDQTFSGHCDAADSTNIAFAQVIEQLRSRGTLVFAASGNTGDLDRTTSPACIRSAVAVGAVDRADRVADFTSRGMALDLLAPGTSILSDAPGNDTATLSGTSMAAAHATGAAALLYAWQPQLDPDAIENILVRRGKSIHDPLTGGNTPRIDAVAAFAAIRPFSPPFPGGGSGGNDCLIEWRAEGKPHISSSPRMLVTCVDGDPACDRGTVEGECTIALSICLGRTDPRLPRCFVAATLDRFELIKPDPVGSSPIEKENANALLAALPLFPVSNPGLCTSPFPIRVAAGTAIPIAARVRDGDGRTDYDRLVVRCRGR